MKKEEPEVGLLFVMILGFLLGMALISCEEKKEPEIVIELSKDSKNHSKNVDEYTYQGCEYIAVGPKNRRWGSHKGNCKNPIHKK
jgi:hypothetical protein